MSWHDDHDEPISPEALDAALDAWPNDALGRAITNAARDYNAPTGEAPRDAMWAAIVGARIPATPDAAPAVVPAVAPPKLHVERTTVAASLHGRRDRARTWWGLAAAAAIFLSTGVGIGRWWGTAGSRTSAVATRQTQVAATTGTPDTAAPGAQPAPDTTSPTVERSVTGDRGASSVVAAAAGRSGARTPQAASRGPDPYDVAIARHLTQAEALLVSYRADTVDVAMDAELAKWARPLLSNTQLLLDSPAADDPRRRRLLEDLELVLAQVARLAPASAAAPGDTTPAGTDSTRRARSADRVERQIIDGTLQRAQLLPRLRNLVASGS
jgi:hypothetical protein